MRWRKRFDADKGGYLDVAEAKSMPKGDKSYAEDKVGRKLDLQAQRLRAKACTLSGAAVWTLVTSAVYRAHRAGR